MINRQNIQWGLKNPALLLVLLRRLFPWKALRHDPECAHLVKSWGSGKLPRRTLQQVFPGIEAVDLELRAPYRRVVGTATDLQELTCLLAVMKLRQARKVLEVGTNDGFTTLNLAANLSDDPDACVCTVDLSPDLAAQPTKHLSAACKPALVGSKFKGQMEEKKIRQTFGDSTRIDWKTLGGPFDLIFIDGGHDFECVKSDTENAFKNLAPGGAIFWHDYGFILDVSQAVDAAAASAPIYALLGTRLAVFSDTKQQRA